MLVRIHDLAVMDPNNRVVKFFHNSLEISNREIGKSRNEETKRSSNQEIKKSGNLEIGKSRHQEFKK